MRKFLITTAALGSLLAMPSFAVAEDAAGGAAGGAAVGAVTGAIVGGPVGAAVGAGVGGVVGAGNADRRNRRDERRLYTTPRVEERIDVRPRPQITEKNCVRDSFGNSSCTTVRR